MKIERKFTKAGQDAYADLDFVTTVSEIRNPDGSVVFKLDDVEVPQAWSQVASDVIAQKYFRKAGVPSKTKRIKEKGVPEFLWRSEPAEGAEMGGETSLASQRAAPNSPQWFNTGLHWAYGIDGPAQGHYYVDYKTGELTRSTSSYEHPQPHARA